MDFSILNDMPTDFKIDRITREAGFQMKTSHVHPFYDITYLINGECTCFVNHSIYKLSKGDLIIIPPGIFTEVPFTERYRWSGMC